MATESVIGTGETYTTIQDWIDALPTTWTDDYIGKCKAEAFNENITLEGFTEGSYTCLLTTNTSASLFDDESRALKYNTSYARVTGTVFSGTQHAVGQDSLTISKLQFQPTHSSVYTATSIQMGAGSGRFIKDILFDCQAQSTFTCIDLRSDYGGTTNIARGVNILVIMSRDNASNNTPNAFYLYGGRLYNCGVVWPTGLTNVGTGNGIAGTSYFNSYVYNTYVFNCSGTEFGTGISGDYNATDAASGAPGINSDHSLTYANQFESTSSWDFRIKTGNNLEDNGNTDATYAPNDIFGNVRGSGTAGTIGPHETPYSAGGGGALLTPWININSIITGSVH